MSYATTSAPTLSAICPRTGLMWSYVTDATALPIHRYLAVQNTTHPLFASETARQQLFRDIADSRFCKPSNIPPAFLAAAILWHCTGSKTRNGAEYRGLTHKSPVVLAQLHRELCAVKYSTLRHIYNDAKTIILAHRHVSLEEMMEEVRCLTATEQAAYSRSRSNVTPLVAMLWHFIGNSTPAGILAVAEQANDVLASEREREALNEENKKARILSSIATTTLLEDGKQWLKNYWGLDLRHPTVAKHMATWQNLLLADVDALSALLEFCLQRYHMEQAEKESRKTEQAEMRYFAVMEYLADLIDLRTATATKQNSVGSVGTTGTAADEEDY